MRSLLFLCHVQQLAVFKLNLSLPSQQQRNPPVAEPGIISARTTARLDFSLFISYHFLEEQNCCSSAARVEESWAYFSLVVWKSWMVCTTRKRQAMPIK